MGPGGVLSGVVGSRESPFPSAPLPKLPGFALPKGSLRQDTPVDPGVAVRWCLEMHPARLASMSKSEEGGVAPLLLVMGVILLEDRVAEAYTCSGKHD